MLPRRDPGARTQPTCQVRESFQRQFVDGGVQDCSIDTSSIMFSDMAVVSQRQAGSDGRALALAAAIVVPVLLLAGLAAGGFGFDRQLSGAPAGAHASAAQQQAQDDQAVRRTAADL